MKKILYHLLYLFIFGCGQRSGDQSGIVTEFDKETREELLSQAADIVLKRRAMTYTQHNYDDYTTDFRKKEGLSGLLVKMKQIEGYPTGEFFFKSLTDSMVIIEVIWLEDNNNHEEIYSVILKKQEEGWINGFEDPYYHSYLGYQVEKQIDLDGDGRDEFIIKSISMNKAEEEFRGEYRLLYLNSSGKL